MLNTCYGGYLGPSVLASSEPLLNGLLGHLQLFRGKISMGCTACATMEGTVSVETMDTQDTLCCAQL